jgi:hypothetical protein
MLLGHWMEQQWIGCIRNTQVGMWDIFCKKRDLIWEPCFNISHFDVSKVSYV